jgi:hypothetical protein
LRLFIFLILYTNIFAVYQNYFLFDETITLKKDQYYSKIISRQLIQKDLHIKWTLYVNEIITMQVNYNKINHQFNLRKSYDEQTFRFPIFKKIRDDIENPYLIIKFLEYKKYNDKTKDKAIFELLIRDPSLTIKIQRKDKKNANK